MSALQRIVWIVVVIVIAGGAFYWWSSTQNPAVDTQAGTVATGAASGTQTNVSSGGVPTKASVTFTGSGFSPSNVEIAEGGTVTWNSADGEMWIASDPDPIDNGYDGTTQQQHCIPSYPGVAPFDECASGTSYSFTFNHVGTWGYHDDSDPSAAGSVTVVAQ